jgi:ABC-type phosphate/phosphonate transport system ATPase subunit
MSKTSSTSSSSALLAFENVSMTFDDGTKALDNVSFGINAGEFVTVV